MTVKNLSNLPFDELMDCFLAAFDNYYVKMPTDKNYYKNRWQAAKVDYSLSYGMFDESKLVGFILHAIDKRNGKLSAFNTGTGVLPEYRGRKIVKSIYNYALIDLKEKGIDECSLDVITKNNRAIKSYQSIGFHISKTYKCFSGVIKVENVNDVEFEELSMNSIDWDSLPNQQFYSWDNQKETILIDKYSFFQVINNSKPESYFIIKPENGYVAQCDLLNTDNTGWERLLTAIKQVSESVKIINVDSQLNTKVNSLVNCGLDNSIDQYEMKLTLA